MKTFKLVADIEFEANDIDDALLNLSDHFKKLAEGRDSNLFGEGKIGINPLSTEDGEKKA